MRHAFHRVLDGMGKVIHGINTPLISCPVMGYMSNPVNNGITHVHIRRRHIDLRPKNPGAIFHFAVFHLFKQGKIFFHAPVPVRTFLARLFKRPSVFPDLICRQIADIGFAVLDQFDSGFIHFPEIIRSEIQPVFEISTQPFHICLDRFHEFHIFLGRIRIIKTQVECAIIFLCKSVVQQDRFGVSDMKVPVRFRREPGLHMVINAFCQVFVYFIFNKIS